MNFKLFSPYSLLFVSLSQKGDGSMKITSQKDVWAQNFKNRNLFLKKNGINPDFLVSANLAHSNKVKIVTQAKKGSIISKTDGLLTQEKNLYLSATVADCLPIFIFDPKTEAVGIIHTGWKSLSKNIMDNAINKLVQKFNSNPPNLLVGIGPAICQKHYEVGLEVAEKFEKYSDAIEYQNDKIYLDLKEIARLQLLDLGVKKENIEISPECTFELSEKYFSARKNRKKEVEAMIAIIGMKK